MIRHYGVFEVWPWLLHRYLGDNTDEEVLLFYGIIHLKKDPCAFEVVQHGLLLMKTRLLVQQLQYREFSTSFEMIFLSDLPCANCLAT